MATGNVRDEHINFEIDTEQKIQTKQSLIP